jgi:predicted nucleotidyltransferase
MTYSKTPHSIRFDTFVADEFAKYQRLLVENKRQSITFSDFVRLSVNKNLREKLYD